MQKIFISTVLLIAACSTVSAQYGNNGYGGNGYGTSGRMSQNNSGMGQERVQETHKEIPVEETVGKVVGKLKTDLNLDELQVIAISNIMTESLKSQEVLLKKETSQEDKVKEMKALSESTDIKIVYLLYKDQKVKYNALVEDRKKNMEMRSERRR